ncbi:hypothetical protein DEU50_12253 [Aeromonas salmonicida]|uniref:Integrase n=1 Tax=Aeromonas salmonicida TaxID=645 RepID=A0AAX1PDJ2_AERSA|nr:hypothetical protein DEU50_12253 [Aeromonas salmonicida]
MPRITRPLSPIEIKAAKPKEKEYTLCDGAKLEPLRARQRAQ